MATVKRFTYDLDITGRNPANLIKGERHTITRENRPQQNVIVPAHTPFFRQSLVVVDEDTGITLLEGVDYTCEWEVRTSRGFDGQ